MANIFYKDFYRKDIETKIASVFKEDDNNFVSVEDNIFHPHGGGQKGDRGLLTIEGKEIKVVNSVKDQYSDDGVLLVIDGDANESLTGKNVLCTLDWDFRLKQMRLHGAAHLHHCMLERVAGASIKPPITSDIQDGFAFNRYDKKSEVTEELSDRATEAFHDAIAKGATVETYPEPDKPGFRWWSCLEFKIPCGGTHVADISEIGQVEVKFSKKRGKPTINITCL